MILFIFLFICIGVLGVRTKYQQKPLPQLNLKVDIGIEFPKSNITHNATILPDLLKLDDDVRLERIRFLTDEDNSTEELPSIVQVYLLSIL